MDRVESCCQCHLRLFVREISFRTYHYDDFTSLIVLKNLLDAPAGGSFVFEALRHQLQYAILCAVCLDEFLYAHRLVDCRNGGLE